MVSVQRLCLLAGFALLLTLGTVQAEAQTSKKPDFLLIVADDLGYSGPRDYGGEIDMPVLVQLAQQDVEQQEIERFEENKKGGKTGKSRKGRRARCDR